MLAQLKFYGAIALLAGFGILAGVAAWQSNRAASALEKLDAVNTRLDALQQGVDASNEAIVTMNESLRKVERKAVTVRERVITMERNDASVKAFLDTPLPANGCMLDDTCATGSPKRGPASAMPAASATAE